jgi:hypothetical protein
VGQGLYFELFFQQEAIFFFVATEWGTADEVPVKKKAYQFAAGV